MPLPAAQLAAGSPAPWRGARPQPYGRAADARPQPTAPPVGGGSPVAGCLGARRWQNAREMRSPASDRGKISPRCVPGRRSVAAFSLHAFPKGPRTGKASVRGKISPPCIRNEPALARYSRHASEKRRKQPFENTPREDLARKGPFSLRGPFRSCTARRSCRRSALAGCWALCVKGLGPGCVSALRIAADGPACRHGISLRSAAAAYPAAERLALRHAAPAPPCSRRPAATSFGRQWLPMTQRTKKRPAFCWPFLRGYELSADYSARSFRRRSSSSASWWRLTLPDSVIGMASMNSMCSGRRRLATPMESRYSAMESSVGSTSPV